MIDVRGLAYIVAEAVDPAQWVGFGTGVLGMSATSTSAGVALKMDERDARIFVVSGPTNRYLASGWEVADHAAFQSALVTLRRAEVAVEAASAEEAAARHATGLARFRDPSGNRHELVWGFRAGFARLISPQGVARFVTGDLGLGHTVLPAPGFDRTLAFFTDVLGFGVADWMVHRPAPGAPAQRIYFLHCNNGRHHSLALFEGEVPGGCVHMMVELDSIDELGRAYDRMLQNNVKLMASLGRHTNDRMISFYMATPSGFAMEVGTGGLVVDWSRHIAFESTTVSLWGHDFSIGFR